MVLTYSERGTLNTLPTIVHGQGFRIITEQPHRDGTPYPTIIDALCGQMLYP